MAQSIDNKKQPEENMYSHKCQYCDKNFVAKGKIAVMCLECQKECVKNYRGD